ncbi:MAG: hypothetical protein IJ680_01975 [Paludibacteraceae bacterium]|nr:hypothetical protein [Paludibacteraceae bacterium]
MIQDINVNLDSIRRALEWAVENHKDSFPRDDFKKYRRHLKRICRALSENCAAAAYGESQTGKSYLMSSLLSSPDKPFIIENKGREYSFIDELNPSGGNNSKVESTGVITRFSIRGQNEQMKDYVKIRLLSVVDVILILADSYYNDVKITNDKIMKADEINDKLKELSVVWQSSATQQTYIEEDDVYEIADYFDSLGAIVSNVVQSDFFQHVADVIHRVPVSRWSDVFGLLWNNDADVSDMLRRLLAEYEKLGFASDVYVPFDAILRDKGSLLQIQWLDTVCGVTPNMGDKINLVQTTDVYDGQGNCIARDFNKGFLSALTAEIKLFLPQDIVQERPFLQKIDLLDFPGARSRELFPYADIHEMLPQMLRRGKVAYLFNKYSHSWLISSLLFCHHNDQKTVRELTGTIEEWVDANVGSSPEQRAEMLHRTGNVSPLFMVATKFNIDLEWTKNDAPDNVEKLANHWGRFKNVIPEIISSSKWFDNYVPRNDGFSSPAFRNIYPLRDFYWSAKNQLFSGYSDGAQKSPELEQNTPKGFPDYWERLHDTFVENQFICTHFADPEQAWNDVATLNNDGSKPIIRDLSRISELLDEARRKTFFVNLREIQGEIIRRLMAYYESEDLEERNMRVKRIVGSIRRSLDMSVGNRPEMFGHIIDCMMIHSDPLRSIVYDITVRHTETPSDIRGAAFVRKRVGLDPTANREQNIALLCEYYDCELSDLEEDFQQQGFSLDDVLMVDNDTAMTMSSLIAKHLILFWQDYIVRGLSALSDLMPHSDEMASMFIALAKKMSLRQMLDETIERYLNIFEPEARPNAIADYTSMLFNKFVSTVGREYMSAADLQHIREKAETCKIRVNLSDEVCRLTHEPQPIVDTLLALQKADDPTASMSVLERLPFWGSFLNWSNLIIIGLLYASDISKSDPVANRKMKEIIEQVEGLYKHI